MFSKTTRIFLMVQTRDKHVLRKLLRWNVLLYGATDSVISGADAHIFLGSRRQHCPRVPKTSPNMLMEGMRSDLKSLSDRMDHMDAQRSDAITSVNLAAALGAASDQEELAALEAKALDPAFVRNMACLQSRFFCASDSVLVAFGGTSEKVVENEISLHLKYVPQKRGGGGRPPLHSCLNPVVFYLNCSYMVRPHWLPGQFLKMDSARSRSRILSTMILASDEA
ncbi:hypothetical protein CAPTEDRAFT_186500 [Capitella teleta]|uniref:Uncharacterized protein n=1 Tax=Capitella teleta TaxID=283909 RepID=R7VAT9_CAPTE|nr:hypothetical protein CAPTEDRAFT_186500 [Capitella teleta]|eukprot:ELU12820.1 hypothetical protein CAPTEDRAFT_186500 [Capitella teleta]